jgi:putative heme-binding domain-containing protein
MDRAAGETVRIEAIRLLAFSPKEKTGARLVQLLSPDTSSSIQAAVVDALTQSDSPAISQAILERWSSLLPQARAEALKAFLGRSERAKALLDAVGKGTVPHNELSPAQAQFLRRHNDPTVREAAARVLPEQTPGTRQQLVDQFLPALRLDGRVAPGREIYLSRCSSCHRLEGQGFALGPDLVSAKNGGKEKLLINILDPNREVPPNYLNYVVETKQGETYFGMIGNETGSSVTLRRANGDENTVMRSNIKSFVSQGQSVMPEGLEAGLTPQDLSDLLEFIQQAN